MVVKEILLKDIQVLENIRVNETSEDISELMSSIKQHGLQTPIGLGKTPSGKYTLLYGSRRFSAFKKLGHKMIPATIVPEPDMKQLLIINATENIQRKDITPYELGRICNRLLELDLTEGEIAARLGIGRNKVGLALESFNSLPEKYRDKVVFMPHGATPKTGKISASVAYRIFRLQKSYGLKKSTAMKMLEVVHKKELGVRDIDLIGMLMNEGHDVETSLKKYKEYQIINVNMLIEKKDVQERIANRKGKEKTSLGNEIKQALFGFAKPFTAPSFKK